MIVVNLFGGPGSGKSTTACGLFHLLKIDGVNCEYVSEQAKNFTWEERSKTLQCQPYIFAKQMRDIWRLRDKVDVVITDSPLLLSLVYMNDEWPDSFKQYVIDQFNMFNNTNWFLRRNKEYNPVGRNQTEEDAVALDEKILKVLVDNSVPCTTIRADQKAVLRIKNSIKWLT